MDAFKIKSFQSGINEYLADGLIKPYEAISALNCNISNGALKTVREPRNTISFDDKVHSLVPHYTQSSKALLYGAGTGLFKYDKTKLFDISGNPLDWLNFEYESDRIVVATSKADIPFMRSTKEVRKLKNRRKLYSNEGELVGYVDDNGVRYVLNTWEGALPSDKKYSKLEYCLNNVPTYAPMGSFLELHYDRLWIAGNEENPDRVYFSTANVNGADIEDWTVPLSEEDEVNQHGGFLDVRSYDGGKIIGMKVIFNSVVLFKNKRAYKIYGSNPENYQLVELFSCNGAIADKSIAVGNNGAYFLNSDGIYYYDGTNTNLISQKVQDTIANMNKNYANESVAIFYDNKYHLAIPTGSSEVNNTLIVYDTVNESFMIYDISSVNSFVEYENKVYYSSGNNIYVMFDGQTVLPLSWVSPMYDFGKKNARKMSNYIYFRANGKGKVKFTLTTEKKEKVLEVELPSEETMFRKKLKNKGRMFQLKIENVDNSSFELLAPEIYMEVDED